MALIQVKLLAMNTSAGNYPVHKVMIAKSHRYHCRKRQEFVYISVEADIAGVVSLRF